MVVRLVVVENGFVVADAISVFQGFFLLNSFSLSRSFVQLTLIGCVSLGSLFFCYAFEYPKI